MAPLRYSWLTRKPRLRLVLVALVASWLHVSCHSGPTAAQLQQMELDFQSLAERFPSANLSFGREIYLRHCSVCHQADGKGVGGAIPPLAGHVPLLLQSDGGRAYVSRLLLYGVNGQIRVDNRPYLNMMPALGAILGDRELAAAFNYALLSWGNQAKVAETELLRPEELAQARHSRLAPTQVLELRPKGVGTQP